MANIEPAGHKTPVRERLVPSVVTFVVAGVAVYATAWIAIGILRSIVMPILAVIVAWVLARAVWRRGGKSPSP